MSKNDEVVFLAVGDIAPSRPDPATLFTNVADVLRAADLTFAQLEINLTERGSRLPQCRHTDRTHPRAAQALRDAGFRIISWAGNHCMDWGKEGFFDTIEALEAAGIQVVGAGANIDAARKPVIVESKGNRIAVLAYSSILPMSYWAEANRPGCAPMRGWTIYEQIEHDQPGTPARIHTYPHREDLEAVQADIRKAKDQADVVIVSMHWGIHFIPAVIADYQKDVGRACIDAGADLILGHHAHILKGFETYKGKAILHCICNFAVDLHMDKAHAESKGFREIQGLHPNWVPDFDSSYNFPADSRRTVVVKCIIAGGKLRTVSLLPTYVGRQSQPEILKRADPRFEEVAGYIEEMGALAKLNGRFTRQGDELLIDCD